MSIIYRVLYTADKQRKLKRWHDGTLHIANASASVSSKVIGNLLGTKPCDIDDDPWDYDAGREKRGYRKTPFVESVKLETDSLQPGEVIETGRHIIEVQELSSGRDLLSVEKVQNAPRSPAQKRSGRAREMADLSRGSKKIAAEDHTYNAIYAVLYTEDAKSITRNWHDGLLKYDSVREMAYFYDLSNRLLLKQEMQADKIQEGTVLESAGYALQICHCISPFSRAVSTSSISSRPVEAAGSTKKWYSLLYTEDKTKKIKKWVDGIVELEFNQAKFWTENQDRLLHKKQMQSFDEEIITGRYIFQVGDEIGDYKKGGHKEELERDAPQKTEAVTRRSKEASAGKNSTVNPHRAEDEIIPARSASEVMRMLRTKELPDGPQEHCPPSSGCQ